MANLFLLFFFALALPGGLRAAGGGIASAGTAGADFLKILVSTRAAGMGGALSVMGEDLSALELNPAGLAALPGWEATAAQVSYFQGTNLEYLGAAGPLKLGNWGASILFLSTPDLMAVDALGNPSGSFSLHNFGASLGWAQAWGPWSAGLSAQGISQSLAGDSASGFAGALGADYNIGHGFKAGLGLQNLGSLGALESQTDALPATLRVGLGWASKADLPNGALVEADLVQALDTSPQVRVGVEGRFLGMLYARAGLQWSQSYDGTQSFSVGAGLHYHGLQLDYAFVPYGALGSTQRFSLTASIFEWMDGFGPKLVLGAPLNLMARPAPDGTLKLAWDAPSAGAKTYSVYLRRGEGRSLEKLDQQPSPGGSMTLNNLDPQTEYGVSVAAVDEKGNEGERSPELSLRPSGQDEVHLAPPLAPRGLRYQLEGSRLILDWDASQEKQISGYELYFSSSSHGRYTRLKSQPLKEPHAVIIVKQFKEPQLFLVVKALRRGDSSEFSPELKVDLKR